MLLIAATSAHQQSLGQGHALNDDASMGGASSLSSSASGTPSSSYIGGGSSASSASPSSSSSFSSGAHGLASSQPALVYGVVSVPTLMVLSLFLFGTIFYMVFEGLSVVDAMYLTTGIITTVGLVVVPRSAAGRVFTALLNMSSMGLGVFLLSEIAEARRSWSRAALRRNLPPPSPWTDALLFAVTAIPSLLLAVFFFAFMEGWPLSEAAYFCITCATGLGMGDLEPRQWTSRLFYIAFIWYTMGVMSGLLGAVGVGLHDMVYGALAKHPASFVPIYPMHLLASGATASYLPTLASDVDKRRGSGSGVGGGSGGGSGGGGGGGSGSGGGATSSFHSEALHHSSLSSSGNTADFPAGATDHFFKMNNSGAVHHDLGGAGSLTSTDVGAHCSVESASHEDEKEDGALLSNNQASAFRYRD